MTHNAPTPEHLALAAVLVTEAAMPDREVARLLGIAPRTLVRWKQREDMALALSALYLFTSRAMARNNARYWGGYWRDELGPETGSLHQR